MQKFLYSLILLFSFSVIISCSANDTAKKSTTPVPVKTSIVKTEKFTQTIQAVGNVSASATVNLIPRVNGEIVAVLFEEGQEIKEGQPLIQIDSRPYKAILDEKLANLAKDEAQLAKARDDKSRYSRLVKGGYVSKEAFEQTSTEAAALHAVVQADRAAVQSAKLDLEYCLINAPISGRIGKLNVHKGNMVSANSKDPIAIIDTISPAYINFSIPEIYLPQILEMLHKVSLPLTAQIPGGKSEIGRLMLLDNTVDSSTGTISLRGVFPNKNTALWPGQYVNVSVPLATFENALIIPTKSIQPGRNESFVYIINDDNKAELIPINPVFEDNENSIVTGSIKAGQKVVTEGQVRLRPGLSVKNIE